MAEPMNKQEIVRLLSLTDYDEINGLFQEAETVRDTYCGREVHLRGIIEFSNYCAQNCNYCGLRRSNDAVTRYRMSIDEILATAGTISKNGIGTIVLQSGEDFAYTRQDITEIIRRIKNNYDTAITLSLGERRFDEYEEWFKAGADRYLLKHETANAALYSVIHNKQKLEDRLTHIRFLKSVGFQTGSGNIIGFPGQTIEDIADDILLCGELDLDMVSFSPFLPCADTPYSDKQKCDLLLTLKTMAVARLYLKNVHIPATTALATLDEQGREKGILAGANVVMPSYTPAPYRSDYKIYNDKKCITEDPIGCLPCLKMRIMSTGLDVATGKGHSPKKIAEVLFAESVEH